MIHTPVTPMRRRIDPPSPKNAIGRASGRIRIVPRSGTRLSAPSMKPSTKPYGRPTSMKPMP